MQLSLKNFPQFLFSTLLICTLFIACIESSEIKYNMKKGSNATDLDYGVSIKVPSSFKKAKSYVGVQAPRQEGSIELVIESDYQQLVQNYSKENLKARNKKLYRLQPVIYGDNENAFYVEFHDKPQKRYRQALIIETKGKVYHVKAFHRGPPEHTLSTTMRQALMSVHIAEYEEKGLPFSEVIVLHDFNKYMYTRDNKYPTEEPDELLVTVENLGKSISSPNVNSYLMDKVNSICEGAEYVSKEKITNGSILKCRAICETKSVQGIFILSNEGEQILILCEGNEKTNLNEITSLMLSKFMTLQ